MYAEPRPQRGVGGNGGPSAGPGRGAVKDQASSILSELGVRGRTRAVLRAVELGYL